MRPSVSHVKMHPFCFFYCAHWHNSCWGQQQRATPQLAEAAALNSRRSSPVSKRTGEQPLALQYRLKPCGRGVIAVQNACIHDRDACASGCAYHAIGSERAGGSSSRPAYCSLISHKATHNSTRLSLLISDARCSCTLTPAAAFSSSSKAGEGQRSRGANVSACDACARSITHHPHPHLTLSLQVP